ncbi:MAG: hypothetical protein JXQ96_23180 [Cyclobacteriaceae bacterium]
MKASFLTIFCGVLIFCNASAQKQPLPIPRGFDPKLNMIGDSVDGKVFHRVYFNAQYIGKLLRNGTKEDVALAEKIVPGLLSCQDTNPKSPTFGGFKWEVETPMVDDLNAVEFLLDGLIPMMIRDGHLLSSAIDGRLREAIRMALVNVDKVDVHYKYTNIILKDITNSCLGGELLGDTAIANRGYRRMQEWIKFTDSQGGSVYEYNALPYTAVALDVLSKLSRLVRDPDTKVRAKTMLARLAVSAGLHMHPTTKRWAGPHGRAYHASYISEGGWYIMDEEEQKTIERWIDEGILPDWTSSALSEESMPDQIIETTGADEGISISTYKSEPYAFGVASRNMFNQDNRFIAWQSNVFSLVYNKPEERVPGIIYTRYINNDEWLGDFSAGPGRPTNMLIPDVGNFQGIQDKNRAIALYAPRHLNAMDHYTSAKSVIALPRWNKSMDKIWVNDQLVDQFPFQVDKGATVVIESGDVLVAIKPFQIGDLGMGNHMEIRETGDVNGTLVFEMYNYQGPAKTFWELAWPGAFFQGWPENGWYSEIAKKGEYENGAAFAKVVNQGQIIDKSTPRFTYSGTEERNWKLEYSRDGRTLGMEVDLFDWFKSPKRWNQDGQITSEMMESEFACQNMEGKVSVKDVELNCGNQSAWLYVSPDGKTVVAAYHGPEVAPFELNLPKGSVKLEGLESGLIVWQNGKVSLETVGLIGKSKIKGGKLIK